MNNSEKRKEYMRNIYSKHWSRTRKKYGVGQYDKDLIHELSKKVINGKILEVGIGDGFPYSNVLDEMEYEVYGIDISPTHIDMVKESLPNINVEVGDSEDLEFTDNFFDVVFCFRSTWYFPDIIKSISEMLRVVKVGGLIMFDIQNRNNLIHKNWIKKRRQKNRDNHIYNIVKLLKNIIKIIIKPIKFYHYDWSFRKSFIYQTPTNPNIVNKYLSKENKINYQIYGVNWDHSFTLEETKKTTDLDQFDRLVYKVSKYG